MELEAARRFYGCVVKGAFLQKDVFRIRFDEGDLALSDITPNGDGDEVRDVSLSIGASDLTGEKLARIEFLPSMLHPLPAGCPGNVTLLVDVASENATIQISMHLQSNADRFRFDIQVIATKTGMDICRTCHKIVADKLPPRDAQISQDIAEFMKKCEYYHRTYGSGEVRNV